MVRKNCSLIKVFLNNKKHDKLIKKNIKNKIIKKY